MDFSKLKGFIFFNDKFIPSKKANIHVLNHSLHFATSVFEGIAVYNGKPFLSVDHFKRLLNSSKLLKLNFNQKLKKLDIISAKLIKKNNIKNGYIRPIVFRSDNSMSPDISDCKTKFAMAAWEWGKLFKKKSISLTISKWPKLSYKEFPIQAKSSGSYQASVISKAELPKKIFDDCVMLDLKKNVAETTACNIFWIKNKTIYTPKTHSILNGITRQAIIKIAKKCKIRVKTGDYKLNKLLNADTVFLTGTAAEIQLVGKIKNKKFNIKNTLLSQIKKEFQNNIQKQINSLNKIIKS
jgi:branched-chain amino acid aminotransferase